MNWRKSLILIFYLLAGTVVGGLLANLAEGSAALSWLAYSKTVGLATSAPLLIDLSVLRIAFGFEMGINVAQVICIGLAIWLFIRLVLRSKI